MRYFVRITALIAWLCCLALAEGPVPENEEEIDTVEVRSEEAEPKKEVAVSQPEPAKKQDSVYPVPEGEFMYSGGRYDKHIFRYRLHIPEMEPGKTYPLILWLHGYGGEIGDNNSSQLGHIGNLFSKGNQKSDYPFFGLFPQCSRDNPGWYAGGKKDEQMATVALSMLDEICTKYPIDENRIILFGISGGASSCWRMLAENPDRFAAAVIAGAGGANPSYLDSISKKTPIWVFHYNGDRAVRSGPVEKTVADLKERGVPAEITLFPGISHYAWEPAYLEKKVLDWMLLQKKDAYLWYPPDMPHWPQRKRSILYSWLSNVWLPTLLICGVALVRYDRKRKLVSFRTETEQHENARGDIS